MIYIYIRMLDCKDDTRLGMKYDDLKSWHHYNESASGSPQFPLDLHCTLLLDQSTWNLKTNPMN